MSRLKTIYPSWPAYSFKWHSLHMGLPERGRSVLVKLGDILQVAKLKGYKWILGNKSTSLRAVSHWSYFEYPPLCISKLVENFYNKKQIKESQFIHWHRWSKFQDISNPKKKEEEKLK